MTLCITQKPSPNYNDRAAECLVEFIIIHYTGMESADAALERMCDPAPPPCNGVDSGPVSAHYLIDEAGNITQMVDEQYRAWHAGASEWDGLTDINSRSIGIELQNKGHDLGYHAFPLEQMEALAALCNEIKARHPIRGDYIVGHDDIAPGRKQDPGEFFDWDWLRDALT